MEIVYKPIAFFKSSHSETYEAPRQGVLALDSYGEICFEREINFDSFSDLKGFDRIWVIYDFHKNQSWKPKVRPPRFSEKKRSVLSSRSPYRPNSIGMSCVKLIGVKKNKLIISEHDILDKTPILDIKPYLPYSDSFLNVDTGWVKQDEEAFQVNFDKKALLKIKWLSESIDMDLIQTLTHQLSFEPINAKSKRVKKIKLKEKEFYEFSIKTWRFRFILAERIVNIFDVASGYSIDELNSLEDVFKDKEIHRLFLKKFI